MPEEFDNQENIKETPAPDTVEETQDASEVDLGVCLAQAEQECAELNARVLRLQADYDNLRRRTRQEREDLISRANERVINKLLPVIDDFARALSATVETSDYAALAQGVAMIYRSLMSVLEDEGLKSIDEVGVAFDPHLHEAIARAAGEVEPGSCDVVDQVYRCGYTLCGRTLRTAMVIVGSAPAPATTPEPKA